MRRIGSAFLVVLIAACATSNSQLVMHSFSFNAVWDSPDVEVLDYRYGKSKQPSARPPDWALERGKVAQRTNITGQMLRPDEIYVKWRVKKTGEVLEEAVDLRERLPTDIRDHRIHFVIKDTQLYVYLISPDRRPGGDPVIGPRTYQHLKTTILSPDKPK